VVNLPLRALVLRRGDLVIIGPVRLEVCVWEVVDEQTVVVIVGRDIGCGGLRRATA
jgi:hypothetical protein